MTGEAVLPGGKPAMKDMAIVIVSWNTCVLLKKCLASIYANAPGWDLEVWVVDNASADRSAEMVRQDFPEVHLLENRENIGFAQANNQAIQKANARLVMLLNPDTELLPGALERLAGFVRQNPAVGAVGPRTLNPDHSLQTSCYPMPTLAREFWRLFHLDKLRPFGVYDMSRWDGRAPRKVDVLLGACILFRQDALDEVGLLSEEYFMYSEEVDLCYRLGKCGWELYWLPEAEMIHYGGQSTVQVSREMFIHLYKSKLLFFRKNYGSGSAFAYKMILLLSALTRLCLTPLAYISSAPARKERLELAHNYSQLVKVLLFKF